MAKRLAPPERIDADPRFAAASAILRTLEDGMRQIDREADALRVEDHLARQPGDARAPMMRERLKQLRSDTGRPAAPASSSDMPASVSAALELLHGTRAPRRDRRAALRQLEEDRAVIHEGIIAQTVVVDSLRDELSTALARRLTDQHRELVLAQYRAAQSLSAATAAEMALRREVTAAGFIWKPELLPAPVLRSALLVGTESDFDSEISRTRRQLEELKIL